MAIYELFPSNEEKPKQEKIVFTPRNFSFSSSIVSRLFCLFLFAASVIWMTYAFLIFSISLLLNLLTVFFFPPLKKSLFQRLINVRRSLICIFCLLLAFFSPSFGMMVGCSYFLMHDKDGIDQVIPHSLRSHFKL